MRATPKVSIVVVNYNYSQYLDERIQSFLSQTYQDFELFIVDNGSTDDSQEIINKYREDRRIRIQFFPENINPYKRWNSAVDDTQGEYLVIAGADDSCDPRMLEKLVEKLDQNPSVGIAFVQSWEVDSEGRRFRSCKENTDNLDVDRWSKDFIDLGRNECQYLLFQCTIPNSSGVLIRRSVFDKAGRLNTQMRLCSDWLLWAKILTISDIAYIAEPLNYFRRPTQGISLRLEVMDSAEEIQETLRVVQYILQEGVKSPKNFSERYYYFIKSWVLKVFAERVPLSTSIGILGLIQRMNFSVNYRLVRYVLGIWSRKMFKVLKSS